MPLYEYEDLKDGSTVGLYFAMGEAPGSIGDVVEIEGKRLRRLPPNCAPPKVQANVYFASQRYAPWQGREWGHRHFDSEGMPVMTSRKEAEKYAGEMSRRLVHGKEWKYEG